MNQGVLMLLMLFAFASGVLADNKYGLKDKIQDGVILHCFDWKLSDIQAEIPNRLCRLRPCIRKNLLTLHGT